MNEAAMAGAAPSIADSATGVPRRRSCDMAPGRWVIVFTVRRTYRAEGDVLGINEPLACAARPADFEVQKELVRFKMAISLSARDVTD